MRKRILLIFLTVFSAAVLMSGCKRNVGTPEDNAVVEETDETDENEGEENEGRIFGYSCSDMSNPFYETLKDSIRTSLEEQGDGILVKDPAGDAAAQVTQIREMIEAEVDAVFVCPVDWEEITPALEELEEADIPVFNLDIEVKDTDLTDAFVGSDNHNAGYVCGENLTEKRPDGGRIVIVENPSVNSINERITGFEEAIANAGFEVVRRIDAGGDISAVKEEMKALFAQDMQIDAVMCGNDQMAEQVLAAAEESEGWDGLVYSVDGSPEIKSALTDPESPMEAAGAQSPINIGKTAVQVATAILNGDDYEKENYEDTFLINRDNVEMYGTDGWQ